MEIHINEKISFEKKTEKEETKKNKNEHKYDVLLTPTLPIPATDLLHESEGHSPTKLIGKAWCMLQNTAAFDITGHPALTFNGGFSHDLHLPIGIQLIGPQSTAGAAQGPTGAQGPKGATGAQGPTGSQGPKGSWALSDARS